MHPVRFISLLLLAALLSGCGTTPPSNYYLLNAADAARNTAAQHAINIGLGPIEFPAYLDRNQIVISTGNNSLRAAEYHRWAEPLESNFARVLAQNLAVELPEADIYSHPWRPDADPQVRVRIKVLRFHADSRNRARLSVRWELTDAKRDLLKPPQIREYVVAAKSDAYDALVAALSQCVAALGRDLAADIKKARQAVP